MKLIACLVDGTSRRATPARTPDGHGPANQDIRSPNRSALKLPLVTGSKGSRPAVLLSAVADRPQRDSRALDMVATKLPLNEAQQRSIR